jgi:type II secretory pathway pseudopilin PulG
MIFQSVSKHGFTLIELVMIILLLGILSVSVAVKWPTEMKETAAVKEFKRAVRYAQHKAMTREFSGINTAWGILVAGNKYTVQRRGTDCSTCSNTGCAEADYCNRSLLDNSSITITDGKVWFNGFGEPFDDAPLALIVATTFTITESTGSTLQIYPETGYVE